MISHSTLKSKIFYLASQAPVEEAVLLVEDHGAVLGDGVGGALPPLALVEE